MDVLYLSALCSEKEYGRMFDKYKTTSSHASQKFHRLICNGLRDNGCNVYTCSVRVIQAPAPDDLSKEDETENGIHYHYVKRVTNYGINRLYTVIQTLRCIFQWSRKHPQGIVICDIIAGEMSIARRIAKWIKPGIYTAGLVTDVPNIRAGDGRGGIRGIPRSVKNRLISSFDSYIFLTEKMNSLLNTRKRPYVIIEGVIDSQVLQTKNTLENKYEEKVCMMAGLLENEFGIDTLLKGFMKVRDPEARLHFYGKGSAVDEIIGAGREDPRIKYFGEAKNRDIVAEEKRATLLINPRLSGEEWTQFSFPSKNMEYMASGTPLVGCRLPCIPEEYLEYFYVISDESDEGFAACLKTILSRDRKDIHAFGLRAQEWIVENKNAEKQARKITEMFKAR